MSVSPKKIFSELKANHLVAIVIDQWAGADGLWTDFFGVPASTTSLPARLAERTGSAIVPAYCIRTGCGEYEIHIGPEASVKESANDWTREMTKELNHILEEQICAFPGQWMWTHRRWKNK